jgi:peptidyl-prolyl cis-trans isomerase C
MALYVNGEKIEEKDIESEMEKLRPDYERVFVEQSPAEQEKQLREWSRENVIEAVIMRQAAQNDAEPVPSEVVEQAFGALVEEQGGMDKLFENLGTSFESEEQFKKDIEQRLRLERLIAKVNDEAGAPSEKEIRNYYESHIDKFTFPETVRASHIVKHITPDVEPEQAKEDLDKIFVELKNGADFVELAEKHSDCPDRGGDLGFFARGQMVERFEEVVFDMQVGEISEVFETEFGFHIATVTDKKPSVPCPIEDVQDVLVRELKQEMQQKAIEKFVDVEKEKATIEEKPE